MRSTFAPTLRAITLAAGLVVSLGTAQAATPEQMQQVRLYGDVTIAQDSVGSWGPWDQFEAPAAGNPAGLPRFGSDISNLYRPIDPVIPPDEPSSNTLEGFATFTALEWDTESMEGTHSALVSATRSTEIDTKTDLPLTVSALFTPHLDSASVPLSASGDLLLNQSYGTTHISADGTRYLWSNTDTFTLSEQNEMQAWAFLMEYINGGNAEAQAAEFTDIVGAVGIRTSDSQMAELRNGNFIGNYSGATLNKGYAFSMTANFGAGTATQSVQNSLVGATYTYNGVIQGSNFTTNGAQRIETNGAIVDIRAQGFFTGTRAAGYIGNISATAVDTPAVYGFKDSVIAKQTSLINQAQLTSK